MKIKVNKETLLKTYKSVIESYYSDIDDINDYNLDRFMYYRADGKIKLQVREYNGLKLSETLIASMLKSRNHSLSPSEVVL